VLYTKRALTLGGCQDKTMRERVKEVFRFVLQDAKALNRYKRCQEPLTLAAFDTLLDDNSKAEVRRNLALGLFAFVEAHNTEEQLAKLKAATTHDPLGIKAHDWLYANQAWLREQGKHLGPDYWNRELKFHHNLTHLFPEIGFLHHLIKLDFTDCEFTHLPDEMSKLTNLQSLNISRNKFRRLPEVIFKLDKLTALNVSVNWDLQELPEGITHLTELQSLSFTNTAIRALPKGFEKLKELNDVSCPNEVAATFPREKFPRLKWLNTTQVEWLPPKIKLEPVLLLPAPALTPVEPSWNKRICDFFSHLFSCIVETISSWLAWLFKSKR
jgi:hypothetical protein